MATTTVLLREDVENLGVRGDIVRVKAGYARNYLLPRKLAVEATPSNMRQIEQERAALMRREAREREMAQARAAELQALRLTFARRAGEHGILYGSVTAQQIAEAIARQLISLKPCASAGSKSIGGGSRCPNRLRRRAISR